MISTANQRAGCDYYTERVFVTRIITLIGRNLKTFLFKIYTYFLANMYMVELSVQYYVYRNQYIRGIILDKI